METKIKWEAIPRSKSKRKSRADGPETLGQFEPANARYVPSKTVAVSTVEVDQRQRNECECYKYRQTWLVRRPIPSLNSAELRHSAAFLKNMEDFSAMNKIYVEELGFSAKSSSKCTNML
jgi:hypothetical protein